MKDGKLNKVLEGYKPIPMKRLFYPRGMKLSEDFINAFHREYDRLVGEGQNPKSLVERFGKAMKFHQGEPRKYKLLDEDGPDARNEAYNTGAEGNFIEVYVPGQGMTLMTPQEAEAYRKKQEAKKAARRKKGLEETSHNKPDHIDADDDGDKKEPMKKAFRDKKKAVSKKKTTKFGKQLQKWADDDS